MSLEKDLAQKAKDQPVYLAMEDLPETVKVLLKEYRFKTDAKGNDAMYLYLETKDGKTIVQKYTGSGYDEILTAIKDAGGSDLLKNTLTEWKKATVGRMQKQRLIPQPKQKAT